ncbi:flagellar assembly protein FliH [Amantichitinum ursilacus]|uniref:Flagellar assembly protein FliH n=1 Tax=Amantichitinum ursilacus TaxID=857265 RepID=A0A0N1JSW9_9NEIS|nr:flagellar assembly protein FliH [Amantichitinum ursilacus]KPC53116.1 Flagellar assembly protein FliH [Amantichitinum ursilacus]
MSTPPRRIIPREEVGDTDWQPLVFTAINDPTPPRMRRPEPPRAPAPAALAPAFAPLAQPEPVAAPEPEAEPVAEAAAPAPTPIDIQQAHAAELEAAMQQAHDAGFEAGHAEGLAAGHAEAQADIEGMRRVLHNLEHFTEQAGGELAENVLDLALVIAREMTRNQVEADPQRLLPIVREMIETMPILKPPARILAHPEDVAALESMLGSELPTDTWKLVPDPSVEPGGCKVESSGSRADLSLATRWQQQLRILRRQEREDLSWQAGKVEPPPAAAPAPQAAPAPAPAAQATAPLDAAAEIPLAAAAAAPVASPIEQPTEQPAQPATAQPADALAQFDPHSLNIAPAPAAPAAQTATPAASGATAATAAASGAAQPTAQAVPPGIAAFQAAAAVAPAAPVTPVVDTNG